MRKLVSVLLTSSTFNFSSNYARSKYTLIAKYALVQAPDGFFHKNLSDLQFSGAAIRINRVTISRPIT